jgi:uncharacterized lipoprotein YajG
MATKAILIPACASLLLTGCIARTALDVVTAPVKVVSKGVDLATTSQSEADEKRGRAVRKREERLGQLDRLRDEKRQKCSKGNDDACAEVPVITSEINRLLSEPY